MSLGILKLREASRNSQLKLLMSEMTAVSGALPHLIQYYMSAYHASSVPLRGKYAEACTVQ